MSATTPFGDAARLIAAALAGGDAELRELTRRPDLRDVISAGRVGPALAMRAAVVGLAGREVEAWHGELVRATSHGLPLRNALAGVASALGGEGIAWAPIKGLGLTPHVYGGWEERPTRGIDVLIAESDLVRARQVLRGIGWSEPDSDAAEADETFLRKEGHAWKAVNANGVSLDLHFRLWGCAPAGLAGAVLTRAEPDPRAGATARRLRLADAWVLGSIHWWTVPAVRPLQYLCDLNRIAVAAGDRLTNDVLSQVRRWGLSLFVAPLARALGSLWGLASYRALHERASAELRRPERFALEVIDRQGVEHAGLELVTLARLLSGRPARMGAKAIWRYVWPHAAALRAETPAEWGRLRRRAWFAGRRLGLRRLLR